MNICLKWYNLTHPKNCLQQCWPHENFDLPNFLLSIKILDLKMLTTLKKFIHKMFLSSTYYVSQKLLTQKNYGLSIFDRQQILRHQNF